MNTFFNNNYIHSFNKLLLQKEELEQKHVHLLQVVESEKTAKWQYTQQCEELSSEIKKLRAEVTGWDKLIIYLFNRFIRCVLRFAVCDVNTHIVHRFVWVRSLVAVVSAVLVELGEAEYRLGPLDAEVLVMDQIHTTGTTMIAKTTNRRLVICALKYRIRQNCEKLKRYYSNSDLSHHPCYLD